MMIWACWSCLSSRVTWRFNLWFSSVRGFRVGLHPRFFDSAFKAPDSRRRRQSTKWDEYKPSRRKRAPDLAGIGSAVGFLDDRQFVGGGERSSLRLGDHLGVHGRRAPRVSRHSAPGGLAPLAFPPLRPC